MLLFIFRHSPLEVQLGLSDISSLFPNHLLNTWNTDVVTVFTFSPLAADWSASPVDLRGSLLSGTLPTKSNHFVLPGRSAVSTAQGVPWVPSGPLFLLCSLQMPQGSELGPSQPPGLTPLIFPVLGPSLLTSSVLKTVVS